MKKFYVASSFRNLESVSYITKLLKKEGYTLTYDWTQHAKKKELRSLSFDDLRDIGIREKNGILESDFIVVLLPGGKGTHTELGIALGQEKKVFLYSSNGEINNVETTSTFYHIPEVEKCFGTLDELLNKIISLTSEK